MDSAAGSAKKGRNRHFQAILSVFGKIYNAQKEAISKLLSSPKCVDIGRAFRTGFGPSFDISKLKYSKIILMSDADCFSF